MVCLSQTSWPSESKQAGQYCSRLPDWSRLENRNLAKHCLPYLPDWMPIWHSVPGGKDGGWTPGGYMYWARLGTARLKNNPGPMPDWSEIQIVPDWPCQIGARLLSLVQLEWFVSQFTTVNKGVFEPRMHLVVCAPCYSFSHRSKGPSLPRCHLVRCARHFKQIHLGLLLE